MSEALKFCGTELGATTWENKYALRDEDGVLLEKSPADTLKRIARELARVEQYWDNPMSYEEILSYLAVLDESGEPSGFGRIVFQGGPMAGIGNDHQLTSLSNCVVIASPTDSIGGIYRSLAEVAELTKRRAGVGLDLSNLRPEGFRTNNSAKTSSGAWSFADLFSNTARTIGQGGRRGALMISMSCRHPDIEKFISCKTDATKVTAANISVRLEEGFLEAVEARGEWELRWPTEGKPKYKVSVDAHELWMKICSSATATADPGLLFWDNIRKGNLADRYDEFKTICTNPCGEIPLSAYDSCRLLSMNVYLISSLAEIREVASVMARLADDLVELEAEKIKQIISLSEESEAELWRKLLRAAVRGRRCGIGHHGLADFFAAREIVYGREESVALAREISLTMLDACYSASADLARERGTFPAYDADLEEGHSLFERLSSETRQKIAQYGRRNIAMLTCAPTGTIAIVCDVNSGMEPFWAISYTRRRKISDASETKPDFVDSVGDKWEHFKVFNKTARLWLEKHPGEALPDFFVESANIPWRERIAVQAALQEGIDHSISSTINLPRGTPVSTVEEIYRTAAQAGLKGVTIYVDGSKDGVMVSSEQASGERRKRPRELDADVSVCTLERQKWVLAVGLLDGKPYEVFCGRYAGEKPPSKATLRRTKRGVYDLIGEDFEILNVQDLESEAESALCRMISTALRHGASIEFVVEQLQKSKGELYALSKIVARSLKKYIADAPRGGECPECKQHTLVYQEGCLSCSSCGYARCG